MPEGNEEKTFTEKKKRHVCTCMALYICIRTKPEGTVKRIPIYNLDTAYTVSRHKTYHVPTEADEDLPLSLPVKEKETRNTEREAGVGDLPGSGPTFFCFTWLPSNRAQVYVEDPRRRRAGCLYRVGGAVLLLRGDPRQLDDVRAAPLVRRFLTVVTSVQRFDRTVCGRVLCSAIPMFVPDVLL